MTMKQWQNCRSCFLAFVLAAVQEVRAKQLRFSISGIVS